MKLEKVVFPMVAATLQMFVKNRLDSMGKMRDPMVMSPTIPRTNPPHGQLKFPTPTAR